MTKLFLDIDNPYANNTMYNDIMHSDSYSLPTANLSHCVLVGRKYGEFTKFFQAIIIRLNVVV